jgi:hypothetical protein
MKKERGNIYKMLVKAITFLYKCMYVDDEEVITRR